MSNILLTNGAIYTFNSNGEIISNENKCVSFKYFSKAESGQTVTLTLNDYIIGDMYGFEAYLSPYLVTNEDEFNSFIYGGDGEGISPGTITIDTGQYDYIVFRFHNPSGGGNTGYDVMINGTLYESVQFPSDDLYKYAGLYINDNLTENDEIVIEIYQIVNRKPVQITFSDNYLNDRPYIYISNEEGEVGGTLNVDSDYTGEYDLRKYNILHISGNISDPQHSIEISVEPEIAHDTYDLEPHSTDEIDAEVTLKNLVYPGENDEYYNNIDYVNIHFKMNWE